MIIRLALLGTTALSLAACSSAYGQEVASAPAAPQAVAGETAETPQSERDRLYAIFAAADKAELELSPLSAIFRGQYENADRIGDFYSDELDAKAEKLAQDNLAALEGIDTAKLNQTDKLAYEVFALNQRETLSNYEPKIVAATRPRPMNHFFGIHTFYPTFESGSGAAPFKTVKDYENAASRHADYVRIVERAIGRFRDGMESGVLETRLTTENMIEQLDTQIEQPLEESPYWGPIKAFPEDFSDTDKARLEADFRTSIAGIYAVNTRLRDFLRDEYLPVARTSVGLSDMKGGDALYAKLIRDTTTLPLTADELHELGKSEVARIQGEMEEVKELMGFEGTLSEFFTYLRTDPKFTPESREWLTEEYYRIGKVVDEKIGDYFSLLPKSELEIRPYEPFREKFQAGGSYQSGSPDGERPGVFYFNAYDLPSRPITQNVTLYLHEGAPGHHFQISIAQENEDLPAFMRFGGTTAYVEGWALYSETLGYEMGLYEDPIARYGTLDDEIFRAIRLVVDTGIHAKGWSRERAIQYMLDNSSKGETDATAEIERYIAIPSQALAYKVGALKIQELRARAEEQLGDDFDIKQFHEEVLNTGALPLAVLEAKIDRWIGSAKGG